MGGKRVNDARFSPGSNRYLTGTGYTHGHAHVQTRADVMPRSATFRLSRGTEPARFSRDTALSNEKDEKGGKKERAKGTEGRGRGGGGGRAKEV